MRKSHRTLTVTRHQEDNDSKETSPLFPIKIIVKLGPKIVNNKTRFKHITPTNNNKQLINNDLRHCGWGA